MGCPAPASESFDFAVFFDFFFFFFLEDAVVGDASSPLAGKETGEGELDRDECVEGGVGSISSIGDRTGVAQADIPSDAEVVEVKARI